MWVLKSKTSKKKREEAKKKKIQYHESSVLLGHQYAFDNRKEPNYLSWDQKVLMSLFNSKWEKIINQFN